MNGADAPSIEFVAPDDSIMPETKNDLRAKAMAVTLWICKQFRHDFLKPTIIGD